MKTEMTERDKKLLFLMAIFVVVVCIGYWGIRPLIKDTLQFQDEIVVAEAQRDADDMRLSQLPMIIADNEQFEEDLNQARTNFYPMMNSSEIDKMFTGMAIEYGLYAYSMEIRMPKEEAQLEPYKYSQKYQEPVAFEEEYMDDFYAEESLTIDAEEEDASEEMVVQEEKPETGIYMVEVSMRLDGNPEDLQKLIDDLSNSDKRHLVKAYRWDVDANRDVAFRDGTYDVDVTYTDYINLIIDLYMCQN